MRNNQNKIKATYENSHEAGRHLSIKIEMESLSLKLQIFMLLIYLEKKIFFPKTRNIYRKWY